MQYNFILSVSIYIESVARYGREMGRYIVRSLHLINFISVLKICLFTEARIMPITLMESIT